jgi:hypothetical protein
MSTSTPAPSDIAKGSWRGTLKSSAHDLSGTCPLAAGIILEINELHRPKPTRAATPAARLWLTKLERIWLMTG